MLYCVVLAAFTANIGNAIYRVGTAYISTHSVYWHTEDFTTLVCIELSRWISFQVHNSILRRVHRVDLELRTLQREGGMFDSSSGKLRVELHNNDSKEFKRVVESALAKKLWTRKDTKLTTLRQGLLLCIQAKVVVARRVFLCSWSLVDSSSSFMMV